MELDTRSVNITLDFVGIVILWLIKFDFGAVNRKIKAVDERLFSAMLTVNLSALLLHFLGWSVMGNGGTLMRMLNYIIHVLFFILHPAMAVLWIIYIEYQFKKSMELLRSRLGKVLILSAALLAAMSAASIRHPIFFGIDDNNMYYRGDYYLIFSITHLIYMLYAFIYVMLHLNRRSGFMRNAQRHLLLQPALSFLGALIQIFVMPGVNTTWIMIAISLQVIYFNFQNVLIMSDELTGLNNRRRYEIYIKQQEELLAKRDGGFYVLMIDVNRFKQINDRLGHAYGDQALRDVSGIILKSVRPNDFVARLSGDEFVVAGGCDDAGVAERLISRINGSVDAFNEGAQRKYRLSLSMGYSMYCKGGECFDAANLLLNADDAMYENKKSWVELDIIK